MKKTVALLAALGLALISVAVMPLSASASTLVSGTITSVTTNLPISNATVEFRVSNGSNHFFTDVNGQFSTTVLAVGTYTVAISAPGYATEFYNNTYDLSAASPVTLADSVQTTINASLQPESIISGTVTDNLDHPVSGANVFLYSESTGWTAIGSMVTLADGKYSLGGLAPGNYKVDVFLNYDNLQDTWYTTGYSQATATVINLPAFSSSQVADVKMPLGATITGTIFDTLGLPVSASPVATGAGLDYSFSGPVDSSGQYTVPGLRPQQYSLTTQDASHFFAPAAPVSATAILATPAVANLVVLPVLPAEVTITDFHAPLSGPVAVTAGQTYTWVVDNFTGNTTYAALYGGTPVYLGGAVPVSNDSTLTLTIPANTAAGQHKFVFMSQQPKGFGSASYRYFTLSVTAAVLPATGVDPAPAALLSVLLVASGALVVAYRRRRTLRH